MSAALLSAGFAAYVGVLDSVAVWLLQLLGA